MDNILYSNPIETVQIISIFTYLNTLSDFLFLENYLSYDDQSRQIPVVNALYKYLEDNQANKTMKVRLVRKLLQGSDLYGENNHENLDVTFVNAMFEYIISSLVFDKYGNIYGFLANVARKTSSLKLDFFFTDILTQLENATFENEYGKVSSLSPLASKRIFTDIILPLFPQPETDLNLLSVDYIYAQAGLIFLQTGKLETNFYTDSENLGGALNQNTTFQDYVVIGHLIKNSLNNENIRLASFKAFALPAFFYYAHVVNYDNEDVKNVIFDPHHWKKAFNSLFSYLNETFNKAIIKLKEDTKYELHTRFAEYKNRPAIAKHFLKSNCKHLSEEEIESKIMDYLYLPWYYHCTHDQLLPNLTEHFEYHLNNISRAYKIHDLKLMEQSFGKSFLKSLEDNIVVIQLLAPDDEITYGEFDDETRIPYDLFVFYYPENSTADYYALLRDNYKATLIKDTDDPEGFQQKTGLTVRMLLSHHYHRVNLKSANQTMDAFWKNFMDYKQLRLESYLTYSGTGLSLGDWWKEFGLSLAPFYPCVTESETNKIVCTADEITFTHPWNEDISTKMTNSDTRSFLARMGTTFNSVQVFLTVKKVYEVPAEKQIDDIVKKLVLHMGEPGYELTILSEEDIGLIKTAAENLKQRMYKLSPSVINILNKMIMFKTDVSRNVTYYEIGWRQYVCVKTEKGDRDTGYGYKFTHLPNNQIAQLRTDYKFKTKIFVSPQSTLDDVKTYIKISETNFKPELPEYRLYEINSQLRTRRTKVSFAGLSVHYYNFEKCNINTYLERMVPLMDCPRYARLLEKRLNIDECAQLALSRNANLTEKQILETMAKYTFPDEARTDLKFMEDWISTKDLKVPEWGKDYVINNSSLISRLRFDFHLDKSNLSDLEGTFKIDSIYTFKERQQIENGVSLESIIRDFNEQKASYVAKFEDYYALRNFVINGYTRITGSTIEAIHMKIALYKLAIRQSDDPDDEFDLTLFMMEYKPIDIIDRTLTSTKGLSFKKFTFASTSKEATLKFAAKPAYGFRNVLYEIKFLKPYLRAKIKDEQSLAGNKVILLPGSEFVIENRKSINIEGLGNVLIIELKFVHKKYEKFESYKNIMKEFARMSSAETKC